MAGASPPAWAQWIADAYERPGESPVVANMNDLSDKLLALQVIYKLTSRGPGQNINSPVLRNKTNKRFSDIMDTVANAAAWLRDNAPKD